MKGQEFKFTRLYRYYSQTELLKHYNDIFKTYLEQVFNTKDDIKLIIEDLKYRNNDEDLKGSLETTYRENAIGYIMPYNSSLRIVLRFTKNNNHIFEFLIYNQNNCCGAMTVSNTFITSSYQNKGLGTLLQYFKEDLALEQGVSLLTCTDVFHEKYNCPLEKIKDLKPYLANTKVLLNTGWKVSKLFYNRKSSNMVGLFTKDLVKLKEDKIISMKIKEDNKLVKVENVTIGTDPELFLRSVETKEFVPSFKYIKGDKYNPVIISDEGHGLSCDNVMVEYTIPPSKTVDDYIKHNLFVQEYLREKVCKQHNLELVITPFAEFSDNELKDEKAHIFGCDPDFNVWNDGRPNEVGRAGANGRCSGGHIHIGYDNHNKTTSNYLIKAMDLFVSVPLVIMEPNNRRKEMYGKAGAFRPQPWGVEYRSPSNYILSSPELMKWAFNQVLKAVEFVNNNETRALLDRNQYHITSAINNNSTSSAKRLIEEFKLEIIEKVLTN